MKAEVRQHEYVKLFNLSILWFWLFALILFLQIVSYNITLEREWKQGTSCQLRWFQAILHLISQGKKGRLCGKEDSSQVHLQWV